MARQPRARLPGIAQHVIQRGVDRQACFFADVDYRTYLRLLADAATVAGCEIHAFVLMSNHVHLFLTPDNPDGVSRCMQRLGQRYVQHINARYRRSGTLWQGRFKATTVATDRYALACYRYIELNPVRAGMVDAPAHYPWSSYAANATGVRHPLIRAHPTYLSLASGQEARAAAYRTFFDQAPPDEETERIRRHTQRGIPYGNDQFRARIESMLDRTLGRNDWGGARRGAGRLSRSRDGVPDG